MDNLELMKQEISNLAKEKKEEFEKVSDYIFANPELAFKEYKSQEALCKLLESHGFVVKRGIAEMPTSFEAVFDSGKPGKTVALMGEYDCLPEIGHGCGHNLIGTSAAGAGIVLKEVMEKHEIGGVLKVLGTPAEEKGSGKAIMVRHGVFEGIDWSSDVCSSDLCQMIFLLQQLHWNSPSNENRLMRQLAHGREQMH